MNSDVPQDDYIARLSALDAELWASLAHRNPQQPRLIDRDFAEPLPALENRLMQACAGRVRELLDQFSLKGTTERVPALDALIDVRDALGERLKHAVDSPILDALWRLLGDFQQKALSAAAVRMTHALGALVEQVGGTAGWIYAVTPVQMNVKRAVSPSPPPGGAATSDEVTTGGHVNDVVSRALRTLVALNTTHQRPLRFYGYGIIGHVALLRRPILMNRVRERVKHGRKYFVYPYEEMVPSTRAEVAVPIYSCSDAVIAILNIESKAPNSFLPLNVAELVSAARRMVPDIRLYMNIREENSGFAWDPDIHGWSMTRLLNRICLEVATPFPDGSASLGVSCTIWHADHETRELHVLGTARFDYEYIADRSLSFDSFLGRVVTDPRYKGRVVSTSRASADGFLRIDKADRMDIRHIVATPLYSSDEKQSLGVLAIYVYGADPFENSSHVSNLFREEVVLKIADVIVQVMEITRTLQAAYAEELAGSRLYSESHPGREDLAVVQKTIRECLIADGSSVFLATRSNTSREVTRIQCAATTGLKMNGCSLDGTDDVEKDFLRIERNEETGRQEIKAVTYPVVKHHRYGRALPGFTSALGGSPTSRIRTNDVNRGGVLKLDKDMSDGVDRPVSEHPPAEELIGAQNWFCEQYSTSEIEHRRFVGYSLADRLPCTQDGTPQTLAVFRVIRSAAAEPFLERHEGILEGIARSSDMHLEACQFDLSKKKEVHAVVRQAMASRGDTWLSVRDKAPKDDVLIADALRKLLWSTGGMISWNQRFLDAVLMDVLEATRGFAPLQASIRVLTLDHREHECLRILRIQSGTQRLPDDRVLPAQRGFSVGLLSIETQSLVLFNRTDARGCRLFSSVQDMEESRVAWGICAPFNIFSAAGEIACVLSIDFSQCLPSLAAADLWTGTQMLQSADAQWIAQAVWRGVERLSTICADNSPWQRGMVRDMLTALRGGKDSLAWYAAYLSDFGGDEHNGVSGLMWEVRLPDGELVTGSSGEASELEPFMRVENAVMENLIHGSPEWLYCPRRPGEAYGGSSLYNLSLRLDKEVGGERRCETRRVDALPVAVMADDSGIIFRLPLRIGCEAVGAVVGRVVLDNRALAESVAAIKDTLRQSGDSSHYMPDLEQNERRFVLQTKCIEVMNHLESAWRFSVASCLERTQYISGFECDDGMVGPELLNGTLCVTPRMGAGRNASAVS